MTIDELKVGSVVRLGRYKLHYRTQLIDIDWIKASKRNDFISEKVLSAERWHNFDTELRTYPSIPYELSFIRRYLNNESSIWFYKMYDKEVPPPICQTENCTGINNRYNHGMLSHFDDHELAVISPGEFGYFRLATPYEIDGQFEYFKRHGAQAKCIDEFGSVWRKDYHPGMTSGYWLNDTVAWQCARYVNRMGKIMCDPCNIPHGIRPVCKLNGDTKVLLNENNTYTIDFGSVFIKDDPFDNSHSIEWLLE